MEALTAVRALTYLRLMATFDNVTHMLKKLSIFIFLTLLLSGCYHIRDPAADSISQTVCERAGYEVSWERKAPLCKEEVIECLCMGPLTADAAVQIALFNSPKIQALFEEVGIAQSDLVNASLIANPVFGAAVRLPDGSFPAWNTEIDALQPIVNILLRPIRKRMASLELASTMSRVTSELFQFIEMVSETFYKTQAAMINLEWQAQIMEAEELSYLVVQKQIEVGNTNELESDIYFENYQEALLLYEAMKIELNTLRQELAQLMGVFDFEICSYVTLPPSIGTAKDELVMLAFENRYDLFSSRLTTDSIATSMGLYQWYAYTDFAAGVAYEKEIDGTPKTGPGFALEVPIFNFGQGDRMRTRALLCQNVQQTRDLCLQIQQEVDTYYEGMVISQKRATQLQNNVIPHRKDLIDQTLRFYNFMNASVFDLLEAKVAELSSEMMLVEAQRDYLIYRVQLIRSLGGFTP